MRQNPPELYTPNFKETPNFVQTFHGTFPYFSQSSPQLFSPRADRNLPKSSDPRSLGSKSKRWDPKDETFERNDWKSKILCLAGNKDNKQITFSRRPVHDWWVKNGGICVPLRNFWKIDVSSHSKTPFEPWKGSPYTIFDIELLLRKDYSFRVYNQQFRGTESLTSRALLPFIQGVGVGDSICGRTFHPPSFCWDGETWKPTSHMDHMAYGMTARVWHHITH